jgi:hypothetical protein
MENFVWQKVNPMSASDPASREAQQPHHGKGGGMSQSHSYRITDLQSFEKATEEPRQIAALYFYHVLDPLVDLAYFVSTDWRQRPQFYRDLGQPSIAQTLAEFNARYGTRIDSLSPDQRNQIYVPIFGNWNGSPSNGSNSFSGLRDSLIRAATAFAQRAVDTGVEMLKEGVRSAHRPFKDYLLGMQGDSIRFSRKALADLTEKTCYPILRNQAVAAVFGIAKTASSQYPYATDPAEDLLTEEISNQLASVDSSQTAMTRAQISSLQRTALRGTEAIAAIIDFEEAATSGADLDLMITRLYTWGTSLATITSQAPASSGRQPAAATPISSIKAPAGSAH